MCTSVLVPVFLSVVVCDFVFFGVRVNCTCAGAGVRVSVCARICLHACALQSSRACVVVVCAVWALVYGGVRRECVGHRCCMPVTPV